MEVHVRDNLSLRSLEFCPGSLGIMIELHVQVNKMRLFICSLFLRYLKEQMKQLKEEKNMAVSALARYKVRKVKKTKTKSVLQIPK